MPINSLLYPANSAVSGGFNVANSVKFNGSDEKMTKSSTAGNRTNWTWSGWIKKCSQSKGSSEGFMASWYGQNYCYLQFNNSDQLRFLDYTSGNNCNKITNRVFRDTSAWYHIVIAINTNDGTAEDRYKLYVNGVRETSFATSANFSSGVSTNMNVSGYTNSIGVWQTGSTQFYNGYVAEAVLIDGTTLSPTSFGEFDEDSGIWKPIDVSSLTFGNNGYYLDFKEASNLGNDANGGTDFTEANLAAIDQSTDTCTNNFATMNPLDNFYANSTLTEGNLKIATASGREASNTATIALTSGKWFWEYKQGSGSPNSGIQPVPTFGNTASNAGLQINGFAYLSTGKVETSDGSGGSNVLAQYATFGTNDIIGTAIDLDSSQNKIYFYKNGALQGSGVNITSVGSTTNGHYLIAFAAISGTTSFEINFGGTNTYSISSGNADGNGFGNFEYAVPSGYFAICTKNLAESG